MRALLQAARSPGYSGEVVRPVAVRCGGQSESPSQQDASGQGAKHGTAGGRSDGNGNGSSDDTNGSNSAPFKAAANVDRGTRCEGAAAGAQRASVPCLAACLSSHHHSSPS